MILRALLSFASLLCLLTGSTTVWAQGTVQFGFEDFETGVKPPYVTLDQTVFPSRASVADSSSVPSVPPFEGQHFLYAGSSIFISSPDGQPIQSFRFDIFVPKPQFGFVGSLTIAGQRQTYAFDGWHEIHGTLAAPAQSVAISLIDTGEAVGQRYAIDAVEFRTVPEPQTFWLLTLGLGAILLRRSKSLKTQSG